MPSTGYLLAVLAVGFAITFGLRALPFVAIRILRESVVVKALSMWMPVGVLAILAGTSLHGTIVGDRHAAPFAVLAVAVTVVVHLTCGRRTIASVGLGTLCYVVLANIL